MTWPILSRYHAAAFTAEYELNYSPQDDDQRKQISEKILGWQGAEGKGLRDYANETKTSVEEAFTRLGMILHNRPDSVDKGTDTTASTEWKGEQLPTILPHCSAKTRVSDSTRERGY